MFERRFRSGEEEDNTSKSTGVLWYLVRILPGSCCRGYRQLAGTSKVVVDPLVLTSSTSNGDNSGRGSRQYCTSLNSLDRVPGILCNGGKKWSATSVSFVYL